MKKFIRISPRDNVAVAIEATTTIPFGHKVALCDIGAGENIVKYGFPIGHATKDIKSGEHIHTHNLKTNLSGVVEYTYNKVHNVYREKPARTFDGYLRKNGKVGIRNEIWIIPTVGCVNRTAELIQKEAGPKFGHLCDGIFAYPHPYGCSQMGADQSYTQKILAGLVNHPNAAGVLVLGLGCENNNIDVFRPFLGRYNEDRVKFLVTQNVTDEIDEALKIIGQLAEAASREKREKVGTDRLIIGLKCGASDAFSGITANPLCGKITDEITAEKGSAILTEVPEMFGAETILMDRATDQDTFYRIVHMINGFKEYYTTHNQVIYENPSPGNKAGGISTLEEKSLGCIQKGGQAEVTAVLDYGDTCSKKGLNLLTGPGNDIVSCTNMTAAGAHMILFTTGRGTPLGAPVPTVKISSNSGLAQRKPAWIDYNAGKILEGMRIEDCAGELLQFIIEVASGRKTKNEEHGYREIAIFKDGVTL
ncbi:MAG: altronate dehydratase [Firmicutes bacterium]|nr:altronate dehydratase [Bacillota bacterium]